MMGFREPLRDDRMSELVAQVRSLLLDEVARATTAGADATREEDDTCWRAYSQEKDGFRLTGDVLPRFDVDSWADFVLVDVSSLGEYIAVLFEWRRPDSAGVQYLALHEVSLARSIRFAAAAIKMRMRGLLSPRDVVTTPQRAGFSDWRERVTRTWLNSHLVQVESPTYPDFPTAEEKQLALDRSWHSI
jgi:hypothetical protein